MADHPNLTETQVKQAEERLLGTKFCFSCQKQRLLEGGRSVVKGRNRVWKCAFCFNKLNDMGFKKPKSRM